MLSIRKVLPRPVSPISSSPFAPPISRFSAYWAQISAARRVRFNCSGSLNMLSLKRSKPAFSLMPEDEYFRPASFSRAHGQSSPFSR